MDTNVCLFTYTVMVLTFLSTLVTGFPKPGTIKLKYPRDLMEEMKELLEEHEPEPHVLPSPAPPDSRMEGLRQIARGEPALDERQLDTLGGMNVFGWRRDLQGEDGDEESRTPTKRALDTLGGLYLPYSKRYLDSLGGFNIHGFKRGSAPAQYLRKRYIDTLGGSFLHPMKRWLDTLGDMQIHSWKRGLPDRLTALAQEGMDQDYSETDRTDLIKRRISTLGGFNIHGFKRSLNEPRYLDDEDDMLSQEKRPFLDSLGGYQIHRFKRENPSKSESKTKN